MTRETVLLADVGNHAEASGHAAKGIEDWLQLLRAEYLEMPGLHLTKAQARRLWSLDPELCDVLLEILIADQFLERTPGGSYARREDGPE